MESPIEQLQQDYFFEGLAASLNASRDLSFDIFVLVVRFRDLLYDQIRPTSSVFKKMWQVREGLEPPTFGFGDRRSTN